MMRREFWGITYEEVKPKLGCSAPPKNLIYFTDEENRFREEVREWTIRELLPYVEQVDANNDKLLAIELAKKACKAGYGQQAIPKGYGGGGRNFVAEIIKDEEMGAASWVMAALGIPSCTFLGLPLYRFGTEEQKEKFMKPLLAGEKIGALGLTEPGAGSDISRMETKAIKDRGQWILNGEKRFSINGGLSDYILTYAVTNPEARFRDRITAFIIETDRPGFEHIKDFDFMGWRGASVAYWKLKDYRVPEVNILGEVNKGYDITMAELDPERVVTAAAALGVMRSAYETAVAYSTQREQFGRKISEFEAISFKLAEMYTKIETARLATWRAAKQIDLGLSATKEAAFAKWYATEACVSVTQTALQVIGGIAYSRDFPLERCARDARGLTLAGGTSEIMEFIISQAILREAQGWPHE
jgi:alkylation response protein AidB-like acyl-CoA dehydrogenase